MNIAYMMELISTKYYEHVEADELPVIDNAMYEIGKELEEDPNFILTLKKDIIGELWEDFMRDSRVWGENGDKKLHDRACQVMLAFSNYIG